jgi:drug/metabolite transporter (DMT)-like permease
MLLGGMVLAAVATITGEVASFDLGAVTRDSVLALLYLTVIGSLLAFTTFGWLLRVAPLPLVTTYAYVNPVVAVILGALVLSEPIDARTVVAGGVIIFAVALIVTARGRMRRPSPARGIVTGSPETTAPAGTPQPTPAPRPASTP